MSEGWESVYSVGRCVTCQVQIPDPSEGQHGVSNDTLSLYPVEESTRCADV
jgi:hypothetical protein